MTEEIWKDIPNYEDNYQVSNLGNLKSLKFGKEKELKSKKDKYGYLAVGLRKNKNQKFFTVHQLVAMAFLNHIPCGHELVVNHINFIKTDNRLCNLELITARENTNLKHIKSSSDFVGVSWHKVHKKWSSQIISKGKIIYLGLFESEEEASKYYEDALLAIKNGIKIKVKKPNFTSDYKGVSWSNKRNKWVVYIWILGKGKGKYIGQSDDEYEAYRMYENYKKQITE